jgi:hypothetical protein
MKTNLIIFLLFCTLAVTAQDQPWTKYDLDSVAFVQEYGTLEQYQYQKSIESKSQSKQLCLLIGAKAIWLYNLAYYLGMNNYNVEWNEPEDFQGVVIVATAKIYTTQEPPTIKIKAPVNDDLITTSATITGPADDLIKLYVNYWELTDLSLNDLKTKKAVTKNFVSDRILFSWQGANPEIKIVKNPDAPIDLFRIN